jgi:hypothetical protein
MCGEEIGRRGWKGKGGREHEGDIAAAGCRRVIFECETNSPNSAEP